MSLLVYVQKDDERECVEVPSNGTVKDLTQACGGPVMFQGLPLDPKCSLADSGLSNEVTIEKVPPSSCWESIYGCNTDYRVIIRFDGHAMLWNGPTCVSKVVIKECEPTFKGEEDELEENTYYIQKTSSEDLIILHLVAVKEGFPKYHDITEFTKTSMVVNSSVDAFINFDD